MPDSLPNPAAILAAGTTQFLNTTLHVLPGTLVPRPETELLAQTTLTTLASLNPPAQIALDACCGVGNIGIIMALRNPNLKIFSSDLTAPCLAATQKNIAHHHLESQITPLQGDLFAPLAPYNLNGKVDLIACNPPYISTSRLAGDSAHLLAHEPREAFDAGPYGISLHARIITEAPQFLRPGAPLLLEFGLGQHKQLDLLFRRSRLYKNLQFFKNAAGEDRVALAFYTPEPPAAPK